VAREVSLCLSGSAPPAEAASATATKALSEVGHATRLDFVDVATAWYKLFYYYYVVVVVVSINCDDFPRWGAPGDWVPPAKLTLRDEDAAIMTMPPQQRDALRQQVLFVV
jgi:hypothetical protein